MKGIDFKPIGWGGPAGFAAWLSRACWVVAVVALTACAVAASGSSATAVRTEDARARCPDDQATTAARLVAEH
jgi:hypothetical protein